MTRSSPSNAVLTLLSLILAACGGGGGQPDTGPVPPPPPPASSVCVDRVELCADELLNGTTAWFTANSAYLPERDATAALHGLMGTLSISAAPISISGTDAVARDSFPDVSVQFITVDDILLPLDRGVISDGRRNTWDIILSPGSVWSEANDLGMSRASFPFTLVTNKWNEAHNGVATFLFDDSKVSNLRFQVTQETALWSKVNMKGLASASYAPEFNPEADRLRQDFRDELAARVEIKAWSDLATDFPGVKLNVFERNVAASDVSASGILVDDTLYFNAANTRYGAYPYPLEMRHGVFSVTKSAQAALTLLRLAQKYGEQVFDLFVTDYLDVTATHSGWNGVTFGHLLNMTAGIGDRFPDPNASVTFADENDGDATIWVRTWGTYPKAEKLEAALGYGDYPWAPGQIVRYNTAHTFILGAALDSFYKTMAGATANVWQMMKDEVYRPIGIQAIPTIQTEDIDPIPIFGFGLFLNAYDTARITQLLSSDGAYDGQQILHRERTRQSMYKTTDDGFPTFASVPVTTSIQDARYLNSFWSFTLDDPDACASRIPYMWGFGGNFVVMLPNGVSAFRYADGDVHDPAALALGAIGIRPGC